MKRAMAAIVAATALGAAAQEFPNRALRIVVPNPAGGTVDIIARAVGQGVGASLGQAVIVDPRPGGNNIIGSDMVAKAAPDGHTMMLAASHLTINPLVRKLPYDGMAAFAPVALLAYTPNVIAVHADLPARNLRELIALAKARMTPLNYASGTTAGSMHLAGERFRSMAGIDMNFIPFQGGVQAAMAVVGGHAEVMVAPLSDAAPHIASGKLRALAVTSERRNDLLKDVPTLMELGFPFHVEQWFGVVVPAGTPKPVITRLSTEMRKAMEAPEVRALFAKLGLVAMPLGPEQFDEFLRNESRLFAAVIRESNIKAD